jgi:hypothetical protein
MKNPDTVMRIGLLFLILASLSRWFFQSHPGFPETLADGGTGLLYGLAIGSLLLSIRMKGNRHCGGNSPR